ncbi:hypothetical protein B1C78_03200 [Thioalkalivibrio denitrificans]|uniref:Uncharacterized protein n=1 Tax=Thioalkalivibrio denitrificans TaxID=108003 RepID=A0A1V3NRK1_9GAMM|nr:hypothetical protein [Thioalkalivibrio denitrificans]OOG27671.1 hypothetical protein B1C78_03200 [Thioalkalivibrio denitrificans]
MMDAATRAVTIQTLRRVGTDLGVEPDALRVLLDAVWRLEVHPDDAAALRDRALLEAASLLDPGGELTPWQLAGRMARAIDHFLMVVARRLRRDPYAELSPLDETLQRAFASGCRVPQSQRRLYDFLR